MFCIIFVNVLVWQWFGVPLIPIYAPLFSIRVPLVPICVILSTSSPPYEHILPLPTPPHPISRYFCKESLITPPPPNTSASLAVVWCSFDSNLCSLIFYSCSLSSYLCYPLYLFPPYEHILPLPTPPHPLFSIPPTNIFCLYPPHPISRYFCKESLITPPPPLTLVLVWQWFGVPLIPIYAPLFSIRVPLVPICVILSTSSPPPTNIFCLYSPHPISRYFCKESLIPPPLTHQPTSSLFTVNVTPPKIFIVLFPSFSIRVHSFSIRVHSCSFVFHSCSLVFTRVHSCSLVFTRLHSSSLVFIRVPLVFTRVHSCSFVFHSCSLVFHSCSLVFTRVHSCSFVFRSVWCFRYDP